MRRRLPGLLLCAPALLVLALCFVWPMLRVLRISFYEGEGGAIVPAWSWATYLRLAEDPFVREVTWNALELAAFAATVAVLLAYPMALFLFRTTSRFRGILAIAAVAPLLVSGTARVIGWMALLSDQGLVNRALMAVGLPAQSLINNWAGVRIGLTESVMPYAVLALIAGLGRLDRRLEAAAASLGAGPLRTFWRITVPMTLPAISAAWLLAFVLGVSAFITPKLMGGGRVFTLATEIFDAALETLDWPAAAALAIYALLLLSLIVAAHAALTRRAGA